MWKAYNTALVHMQIPALVHPALPHIFPDDLSTCEDACKGRNIADKIKGPCLLHALAQMPSCIGIDV